MSPRASPRASRCKRQRRLLFCAAYNRETKAKALKGQRHQQPAHDDPRGKRKRRIRRCFLLLCICELKSQLEALAYSVMVIARVNTAGSSEWRLSENLAPMGITKTFCSEHWPSSAARLRSSDGSDSLFWHCIQTLRGSPRSSADQQELENTNVSLSGHSQS